MKNLSFAGIAIVAMALSACGDDTGGTGTGSGGSTSASTTAASTGATTATTGGSTTNASSSTGEGAGPGTGGDSPAGTGGDSPAGTGGDSPAGTGGSGGGGTGGEAPSNVQVINCEGAVVAAELTTTDGFQFDPSTLTISAGEVVRFTAAGNHSMVSDDGEFTTTTGDIACLQFDVAGDYPYHCGVHGEGMAGTITVE